MGCSDLRSDNWALGVVLYLVISGKFPFKADTVKATLAGIFHGAFTFDHPAFHRASYEVKDLVAKLLTRNPNERLTAFQAFHHPWVQRLVEEEDRNIPIDAEVICRLQEYQNYGE